MNTTRIIGIDCATVDEKIGVALGWASRTNVSVDKVALCGADSKAVDVVSNWINQDRTAPCLIGIDAPLGWPVDLSAALREHVAGSPIATAPDAMFRRQTDRFVYETLRKTPLDVGADRIARTAHAALALLARLATPCGFSIPMAWSPQLDRTRAIEVYPAATLLAHRLPASGYKKRRQSAEREELVNELGRIMTLPTSRQVMLDNADALDAAVCVLAGADFLRGEVHNPTDRERARREGWIWFFDGRAAQQAVEAEGRTSSLA